MTTSPKERGEQIPFKSLDALDKKYKPKIIKWLCSLFGYQDYPHSFKDQWINWNIWDGEMSISFDLRQEEQVKLLSMIHPRFIGCPQQGTLKIVNEKSFYLSLKRLLHINYPRITSHKLTQKVHHKDNDGDDFYVYYWTVYLDDDTCISYSNQSPVMDLKKGDFSYNATIQQRAFCNFLDSKF